MWRTIGWIPCFAKGEDPTGETIEKLEDYHFMLGEILRGFKQCQKEKVAMRIQVGEVKKVAHLRCYILFIIGDTLGHDALVCRFGQYKSLYLLCQACGCPSDDTDNPLYNYCYTKHKDVVGWIDSNDEESLQRLSLFPIKSAFHNCMFCDP